MAGCLAWAAVATAGAAEFGLAQLASLLSSVKSGEATFTERRQVAMLDRPLESSGKLWFEAPDTFVRETLKPRHEKLAVTGNTLTMSQGPRSRTVPLDSAPEAGVILEAIRGTLTGDRESLERHFSVTVAGSPQAWTLELLPREASVRTRVASVNIAGSQALVHEIRLALPDGDSSVMTIEPTVPGTAGASAAAPAQPAPPPAASGAER